MPASACPGLFITGTDTGIGKTVVGCALVRALVRQGRQVVVRKPVESGCERHEGGLWPADGARLMEAAGSRGLARITPHRFEHALAPDRAARLADRPLYLADLIGACHAPDTERSFVVVEGAGGFYSPLAEDGLNADLAQALGLPIVLVAPDRVGVINHVLLIAEAIRHRNLSLAAVVLNHCEAPAPDGMDNGADIAGRLPIPVMRFPQESDPWSETVADQIVQHISPGIHRD
ncbi:dethiobiotin synthase [Ectothiorhodospira lacustris]|uniref:dethiobiotin synthase n=1 Tax=Ectothiorhodospira lacustris TaxID=2899127 RepID=UPI001EE84BFA|nr:dethiobiotin synthase [Ectothiorhodospira lacustris]MCG5510813.1 dethiobiotin synthase [Ectothiorhodospira lacustris]MCG5522545.1 dethiobiotin synthase [Ectothiorhodospira lacustris]